MTLIACWSAKGGAGTTVVAACLALESARPSVLIDIDGDQPIALGVPEPSGQGLSDWFASDAPPSAVLELAVDLDETTRLIARGPRPISPTAPRWGELGRWLAASRVEFVADVGLGDPPAAFLGDPATDPQPGDVHTRTMPARGLLVTRPCYVAVMHARLLKVRPHGIVLVDEPGHNLGLADIERSIGAPIVAKVPIDPAVARAVDSGLLAARLPGTIRKILERAA